VRILEHIFLNSFSISIGTKSLTRRSNAGKNFWSQIQDAIFHFSIRIIISTSNHSSNFFLKLAKDLALCDHLACGNEVHALLNFSLILLELSEENEVLFFSLFNSVFKSLFTTVFGGVLNQ
jgi:hypothetical protein